MSFDEDPRESTVRILCYHPESDNLFITTSRARFEELCYNDQIDDVTGVEWAEKRYAEEGQ